MVEGGGGEKWPGEWAYEKKNMKMEARWDIQRCCWEGVCKNKKKIDRENGKVWTNWHRK